MILVFKYIFPRKYAGLALWPFIIVKNIVFKDDHILMNHERIHLRQQLELLVVPFYIWYTFEWCIHLMVCRDPYRAYRRVSFEQEAYKNEGNLTYLKDRRPWSFLKYLGEEMN